MEENAVNMASQTESHINLIVVRSSKPFKLSLTLDAMDAEVMEIKSHSEDSSVDIISWFNPRVFRNVDKQKSTVFWNENIKMATDDNLPTNPPLSRSSSTSSFEAIMEGPITAHPFIPTAIPSTNQFTGQSHPRQIRSAPVSEPMTLETKAESKPEYSKVEQVNCHMMEIILKSVMNMVNMAMATKDQASLDCLKGAVLHFAEEMLEHESLVELPFESLISTIKIPRNESAMEYALSKCILKWAEARTDRCDCLAQLLTHIQLDKLDPEQLIDIGNHPLIRYNLACRDIIDVYKNSILMTTSMSFRSLSISSNMSEIISQASNAADISSVLTSSTHTGSSLCSQTGASSTSIKTTVRPTYLYILARGCSNSEDYSIHQIDMETGISLKIRSRPTFLCVNLEDNLYVFGHPNSYGRSVEMYNFEKQVWTTKANWPTDLIISSVCVVGKFIYFLGFRDNGPYSLHQYDPFKDHVTPIRIAYEWVAIDGDIILSYEGLVLFVKTGLSYNPIDQRWKNMSPIPERMVNGQSLTAYKDRLVNFCTPDQFYWFNPKDGTEGNLDSWNLWLAEGGASYSLCPRVELLALDSKLYLVEKAIFENCTLQVIRYDDNNDRWIKLHLINLIDKPIRCAISSSDS